MENKSRFLNEMLVFVILSENYIRFSSGWRPAQRKHFFGSNITTLCYHRLVLCSSYFCTFRPTDRRDNC